jgi:hypothetical protein
LVLFFRFGDKLLLSPPPNGEDFKKIKFMINTAVPKLFFTILMASVIFISCNRTSKEEYYKEAKSEIKSDRKLELLTKAIEIDSNYFDAIYERACVNADLAVDVKRLIQGKMADKGDDLKIYNDCLKDFEHVFRLNPNHAPSYFKRGVIEHWMGDSLKACVDLNKSASLGYDCSSALKDFCK